MEEIVQEYDVDEVEPDADPRALQPRFNIAPSEPVAAVVARPRDAGLVRLLVTPTWGLVPSWTKDLHKTRRPVNARAETVAVKPSFRNAFARRRCLLPADGYYEWQPAQRDGRTIKQPWWIHPARQGEGLAMAGIYEFWRDHSEAASDWLVTCCIITTTASDDLGQVHDRMPVQILPGDWEDWLDPDLTDADAAHSLLHIPGPGEMTAYQVSTAVNSVAHDGPALLEPLSDRKSVV